MRMLMQLEPEEDGFLTPKSRVGLTTLTMNFVEPFGLL
jgi:hypothetical protein